jgi:hypothetical protein
MSEHVAFCTIVWQRPGRSPQVGDRVLAVDAPEDRPPPKKKPVPKKPEPVPEKPEPAPKKPVPVPEKPEPEPKPRTKEPATPVSPSSPGTEKPDTQSVVKEVPRTEAPVPPLEPRPEELLAVGAAGSHILVSSNDGVYVFSPTGMRYDESVLPHELLRFVPWGSRLWAETHGGVLLWEDGAWREFPWSRNLNMEEPAFARVAVSGETAWGVFGSNLLRWNPNATTMTIRGARKRMEKGAWEQRGAPVPDEIQAILGLSETELLLGTRAAKLYVKKEGARPSVLAAFGAFTKGEDPLLLELARDAQGATWGLYFGEGGGLFRAGKGGLQLVPRAQTAQDDRALPPGTILRLMANSRGRVHVLHEIEGVFEYRFGRWERLSSRPPERAVDMTVHGDDVLLLTEKRLVRLRGEEESELHVFENVSATSAALR